MNPGMIVRLRPAGPWRIGPASGARNGVDHIFHSDSLYSAVSSAIAQIDWIEEWFMATAESGAAPQVRFSSCFPYQKDTLYVPPPRTLWPPPHAPGKVRWQGARFVPISIVQRLLGDQPIDEDRWTVDGATGCVLPADRAQSGPFRNAIRSSAAVDRVTGESVGHTTACLEFAPDAGLWCVVSFSDEESRERWAEPVRGAFRLLADSGLGGERSRGWGRAEAPMFKEGALPGLIVDAPQSNEHGWWLLSVFSPGEHDSVDWSRGNYSLMTRSGRVESRAGWGAPKRASRVVAEGAVLVGASAPVGAAVDVAPEGFAHPVYRYGYALCVPVPSGPSRARQQSEGGAA